MKLVPGRPLQPGPGQVADGLHVLSFHSPRYLRECVHPAVQEELNRGGRSRADFTFRAATMVVLGGAAEERAGAARAVKKHRPLRVHAHVPGGAGRPRARGSRPAGDWEGVVDLISDETLDHFAVSGSVDDPRRPALLARSRGARGPVLQSDRERRSAWRS